MHILGDLKGLRKMRVGKEMAINLSALLTGKALEVYFRLTSAEADEYDTVKDSLLKRYQLTEEGFRQTFRDSKPEKGDTSSQFVSRLQSYLGRWMKLGNVAETFEGIKDLFLREQFLEVCNKNLTLFLKSELLTLSMKRKTWRISI